MLIKEKQKKFFGSGTIGKVVTVLDKDRKEAEVSEFSSLVEQGNENCINFVKHVMSLSSVVTNTWMVAVC